ETRLAAMHDATSAQGPGSDIHAVLRFVARNVRRRTVLVVVSDTYAVDDELATLLRRLSAQHEVLFVSLGDLDPTDAPSLSRLVDVDTRELVPEWARHDARLHAEFASMTESEAVQMRQRLYSLGVVHEH